MRHLFLWLAVGLAISGRPGGRLPPHRVPDLRRARHVSLVAVGDVMLARGVGKAIAAHGAQYPLVKVREVLRRADLTVFNLECALSTRGSPQHDLYLFRADPSMAKVLAANGFKVAVLANNHTLDYGPEALMDTLQAVEGSGMTAIGAGKDRAQAVGLKVVARKGLRIGFLAYSDIPNAGPTARDDMPSVASVKEDTLPTEVGKAKARCDTLIVFFHWGVEYMARPTERQRALARRCVDAGADLVLGCHPHVLQTVETYKGKLIVYSMGGFVFDSRRFGSDRSAMFFFQLGKRSARLVRTIPILVKGGQAHLGE